MSPNLTQFTSSCGEQTLVLEPDSPCEGQCFWPVVWLSKSHCNWVITNITNFVEGCRIEPHMNHLYTSMMDVLRRIQNTLKF